MLVGTCIATAMVAAVMVTYYTVQKRNSPHQEKQSVRQKVRTIFLFGFLADDSLFHLHLQLPNDLDTWRMPGNSTQAEEQIWQDLDEVFRDRGFTLWPNAFYSTLSSPGLTYPLSSGFSYATPSRGIIGGVGTVQRLCRFDYLVRLLLISLLPSSEIYR